MVHMKVFVPKHTAEKEEGNWFCLCYRLVFTRGELLMNASECPLTSKMSQHQTYIRYKVVTSKHLISNKMTYDSAFCCMQCSNIWKQR